MMVISLVSLDLSQCIGRYHTIVQDNDVLLSLKGFGSDGTNFEEAAQIEMQVDGTPINNVMPGRIVFKTTTTDGVAERMRISKEGYVTKPNNPAFHDSMEIIVGRIIQVLIIL